MFLPIANVNPGTLRDVFFFAVRALRNCPSFYFSLWVGTTNLFLSLACECSPAVRTPIDGARFANSYRVLCLLHVPTVGEFVYGLFMGDDNDRIDGDVPRPTSL